MNVRIPKSCKVYTPDNLAFAIVAALNDEPNDTWLEPCFGRGAFLRGLAHMGIPAERILAVDLERNRCDADMLAQSIRGTEFLGWSLSTDRRFSKIVANPPFVSFRRLANRLQSVADRLNCHWAGSSNGNSNLWFAFLRASLSLLRTGGSIGFIVPAAFEYADYAATLREEIHNHFAEFEVHRCRKPLFEEVQDGCVVLIGRGYELQNRTRVRCEYASGAELIQEFGRRIKCTAIVKAPDCFGKNQHRVALSEIMKIRIGCVTGDAKYFLLRDSERIQLKLPLRVLQPVLSRARHLQTASVTKASWEHLKACDERVWLFRPEKRHIHMPTVRKYLRLAEEKGGCNRKHFKVKNRAVWYRPDLPQDVDGFVSGTATLGPWISLKAYPKLFATNTLYCVTFKKPMSLDEQAAWALSLLTKEFREQLSKKIRTYPDGLAKIEPGDLMAITVAPPPKDDRGAHQVYQLAIKKLIEKGRRAAETFAEEWIGSRVLDSPAKRKGERAGKITFPTI